MDWTRPRVVSRDGSVVQSVDVPALVEIASRAWCTIELTADVGDAILDSTPILRIRGGVGPLPEEPLRRAIELGSERTFEQDPKYAIRLLVDIAIKALSPAINDPTTACRRSSRSKICYSVSVVAVWRSACFATLIAAPGFS